MYRTNNCGELRLENVGQKVTLAGWVQKSRRLGGMTFVDLRDRYGITQLVVESSAPESLVEIATSLGREYVIQASGTVVEREKRLADKIHRLDTLKIPDDFDFDKLNSISIESRQKLKKYAPKTIAEASRISGVSPSDISVLLVYFGR